MIYQEISAEKNQAEMDNMECGKVIFEDDLKKVIK